jgi:hypothetical protein
MPYVLDSASPPVSWKPKGKFVPEGGSQDRVIIYRLLIGWLQN